MSNRHPLSYLIAVAMLAPFFITPAAAQQPGTGASLPGSAIGGFVGTFVVGGALLVIAPRSTKRRAKLVPNRPAATFVYGFGLSILLGLLIGILAITGIGLLLALPLAFVVGIIGEYGFLAAGYKLTGSWFGGLVVAAAISGFVLAVPLLGWLVGGVLSCMGVGSVYLDDGEEDTFKQARDSSEFSSRH
jgi:hypothetical protein